MKKIGLSLLALSGILVFQNCQTPGNRGQTASNNKSKMTDIQKKVDQYIPVKLTTDMSQLTDTQKKVLGLLIDAAQPMNAIFWQQTYGNKDSLMAKIKNDAVRKYAEINYGPWDRLNADSPFVKGFGPKPAGANFYPHDMTKEQFEAWKNPNKKNLYTLIRRDKNGQLITVPYSVAFAKENNLAAKKLEKAADITQNAGLSHYLKLRAHALLTDSFKTSDIAWLHMKDNKIGIIIGPIETYEDQLFGYKASNEAMVVVKDEKWSQNLKKFVKVLPEMQAQLPIPDKYKQPLQGSHSDLGAYDIVYYAGAANTGGKTIAVNLPNDPHIRTNVGTRRLELENVMRAKYNKILIPIAKILMTPDQQQYLSFNAFFSNTMLHEVAHGLGISHVVGSQESVRDALKENYSALEEGKADVLGLYLVGKLRQKGLITTGNMKNNYVTFVASIFRSIRFGAKEAHGLANLIRFNFYLEKGAIVYNKNKHNWTVDFSKIDEATKALSQKILMLQGDGNYDAVATFVKKYGNIGPKLQESLDLINKAQIPVDITFEQGRKVLGL